MPAPSRSHTRERAAASNRNGRSDIAAPTPPPRMGQLAPGPGTRPTADRQEPHFPFDTAGRTLAISVRVISTRMVEGAASRRMVTSQFAFVMEQTLGHVAHSANLERALARTDWVDGDVFSLPFAPRSALAGLPGLRNWSLRASLMARAALHRRRRQGPLDAAFIHTQVAALLSIGIMRRV